MNRSDFFKVLIAVPIIAVAKKLGFAEEINEGFEEYHKRCGDIAAEYRGEYISIEPYLDTMSDDVSYDTFFYEGDIWVYWGDGKQEIYYWNEHLKNWLPESGARLKVKSY